MIIIDIGACVGEFTDFCLANHPVDVIYLFEPLRVNYEFLATKYQGHEKVKLFHLAVSNFEGQAKFYKKGYAKDGSVAYDVEGNAGSSLKIDKSNVSKQNYEVIQVVKLSAFLSKEGIRRVDILKIDVEGSEYDIIGDIIDNNLYPLIDKIYYEDHARKVASIKKRKAELVQKIRELGILDKFYLQTGMLEYICAAIPWAKPTTKT